VAVSSRARGHDPEPASPRGGRWGLPTSFCRTVAMAFTVAKFAASRGRRLAKSESVRVRATAPREEDLPADLVTWLNKNGSKPIVHGRSKVVDSDLDKDFVLVTVPFQNLEFKNHHYNPRTPNEGKIFELVASVRSLGLLNPLVCAYIGKDLRNKEAPEPVVLIDGRHRYEALVKVAKQSAEWKQDARVDLKIYYNLPVSDLHLLATYLNRTRRALKKGEYYRAVVEIYENRKSELEKKNKGKPQTETDIFSSIQTRELNDLDFDMSVGRIVGITAFDEEEDEAWFPMVAINQNQRFEQEDDHEGYVPLTAGNLAEFLRPLCNVGPYDDFGQKRAVEISNVLSLGEVFRKAKVLRPYTSHKEATPTSVACKFWTIVSFGKLLAASSIFPKAGQGTAPMAHESVKWSLVQKTVEAYHQVMTRQSNIVNDYKKEKEEDGVKQEEFLQRAWSYQTQRDQVIVPLKKELSAILKDTVTFSGDV
jgi:ParB-like nuclease family protein